MTEPTPAPSTGPLRLLVTGASGNIDTTLLRALAADDPDHRTSPSTAPYDTITRHELDLAGPRAADYLAPLMIGVDAVVHLAWGFQPSCDVDYLRRTALGGTHAVIRAVRRPRCLTCCTCPRSGPTPPRSTDPGSTRPTPSTVFPPPLQPAQAAAERMFDALQTRSGGRPTLTRLRPGFVLQRDAASGLLRYGLPGYLPAAALRLLKVLPVDRRLLIPVVHADDVADAILRALRTPVGGVFNLAQSHPLTATTSPPRSVPTPCTCPPRS